MEELESQIAKITLGNFKQTKSYVYVMAEKAPSSDVELYVVAELPFFNPAAAESCERICLAIGSSLKRAYRQHSSEGTFENALNYINDELSKLATLGQTHWINKLNCIVAAKDKNLLTVASCGKVVAYMLRDHEFTDISCSSEAPSPIKTFESYASGKIRLGDLVMLSTTQLFNYLSVDRVKNILRSVDFLPATQTIIDHLKTNAGPEVAFGILMSLQVELGQTPSEEVDLENFYVDTPAPKSGLLDKPIQFIKELLMLKNRPATQATPNSFSVKKSWSERMKFWGITSKTYANKTWIILKSTWQFLKSGGKFFSPDYFKSLSGAKKIFYSSIVVLLLAFCLNIWVAVHVKNNRAATAKTTAQLEEVKTLLDKAQDGLVYGNQKDAVDLTLKARTKYQEISAKSAPRDLYQKIGEQLNSINGKIDHVQEVKVTVLGNLSPENLLIKLPGFLGTQTNGQIISYNKTSGQIQDNVLKSQENIKANVTAKEAAVIFNGSALFIWKAQEGKLGPAFSSSVPAQNAFAGLKYYPTNNRVYVLDKSQNTAVSFLINGDKLQNPVISLKNVPAIGQAQDFGIDGSIYILTQDSVVKYSAGKLAEYNLPYLSKPFSGTGKIATQTDFKNLYILDIAEKRIIVTNKTGTLRYTIKNTQLTNPKDFEVDEKNKTIYVLNNSELLKLELP